MYQVKQDRPLGELFGDLGNQASRLLRQELDLARTEMSETAVEVGKNVGFLAVGGAIAYAGFLALLAALVIGLGQLGLPWWLSALLVGLVVAGIGYFLIRKGLDALSHVQMAPKHTMETIKEDTEWAKRQMK